MTSGFQIGYRKNSDDRGPTGSYFLPIYKRHSGRFIVREQVPHMPPKTYKVNFQQFINSKKKEKDDKKRHFPEHADCRHAMGRQKKTGTAIPHDMESGQSPIPIVLPGPGRQEV